jgi:chromosome partitioning protein
MAGQSVPNASAQPKKRSRCRIVVLSSPKGGTGKTTFAMNFLSLASREGHKCLGVDLDPQETLVKWARRRDVTAEKCTELPMFDVLPAPITHWQQVLEASQQYDIAIIDMLPSVDHCISEVHGLCQAADLVLVPTGATMNDLDSNMPWITQLNNLGFRVAACLNRANRREVFFEAARGELNGIGRLCPVEVRYLTDAHSPHIDGLAAVDKVKSKSGADFESVWRYVSREIGVVEKAVVA